jgi:hypothetical protein
MLVDVYASQTFTAVFGSGTTTYTPRISMRENTRANLTVNVWSIELLTGTPSVSLTVSPEASNDGLNWVGIVEPGLTATSTGLSSDEGYVGYAWIRFLVTFTLSGSAGDKASVVFDLQARLLRK